ncbi:hypothetical protein [Spiroplasma endosymbiont of Virgichneumon dumeticola]|uniref:hypothetical protein n=1 Tax=Spiroplasma endosymbiont of Virgichneumon dumeticola TaxID=3139323 RepID=UPI0035C92DF6
MNKEIEQQIKEFTNQINIKLTNTEQEVLNIIINNYINISKHLIDISEKHKKEH